MRGSAALPVVSLRAAFSRALQLQLRIFSQQISSMGPVARFRHPPLCGQYLEWPVRGVCVCGGRAFNIAIVARLDHGDRASVTHQAIGAGFSFSARANREITRTISSVPLSGVSSMYRTPAF